MSKILFKHTGLHKMTNDELRWAHMTAEELVRELSLRDDLTVLETILVARIDELLEEAEQGFGEHD